MPEFVKEFDRGMATDADDERLDAPAFHRNVHPMSAVLQRWLAGRSGDVLEIGSGTGQHVIAFAKAMPALTWWPSDPNPRHLKSIAAWSAQSGLANVAPPFALDAANPAESLGGEGRPPVRTLTAIVSMNVIHIAPWRVCEGILRIAGLHLAPGGLLFLYGPFKRGGRHTAPSNEAFDASLRHENPEWGVRDVADVEKEAGGRGLGLAEIAEMPANNLTLVFEGLRRIEE